MLPGQALRGGKERGEKKRGAKEGGRERRSWQSELAPRLGGVLDVPHSEIIFHSA